LHEDFAASEKPAIFMFSIPLWKCGSVTNSEQKSFSLDEMVDQTILLTLTSRILGQHFLPTGAVRTMAAEKISETIDVFLLAENRLLREALGRVLSKKNDIRVLAASAFATAVVAEVADCKPHVLLIDSAVFACSDVRVVTAIRQISPAVKILMIGMENDEQTFLRCVRAGVTGYLLKDASAIEIAAGVRSVAYEEAVCPPRLCSALFDYVAKQRAQMPTLRAKVQFGLTRREQQLVQMISGGLSNKEIASQLNLSEQTIKNHVHRVLRKLGAGDRLSAVEFCRQEGIVA